MATSAFPANSQTSNSQMAIKLLISVMFNSKASECTSYADGLTAEVVIINSYENQVPNCKHPPCLSNVITELVPSCWDD